MGKSEKGRGDERREVDDEDEFVRVEDDLVPGGTIEKEYDEMKALSREQQC